MQYPAPPAPSREPRPPRRAGRWVCVAAILGSVVGAGLWGARELFPARGTVARGVTIEGLPVPAGQSPDAAALAAARRLLDRRLTFSWGKETLVEATVAELGGKVDVGALTAALEDVGREEDLATRVDSALEARRGHVDFRVRVSLPVDALADRLARLKEERDTPPVDAKLDWSTGKPTAGKNGEYMDVYAAAERAAVEIDKGAEGEATIVIPDRALPPLASPEVVAAIDTREVVAEFETVFGFAGNQVGRAQNIHRAAGGMNGVVLMPGEVVSFNANVGARSIENGFAEAPEIYKGEIREGVGGGTCQVAGTLHAAAYMAGVDVVERAPHSRPSGYIRMGLDATVVFPTVDLKLRNPYSFPLVVHAVIDGGKLTFSLRGKEKAARVSFDTETVGTYEFKRKIEEVAGMAEGEFRLKQHGIRGYSIKKTRVIHELGGRERTEITTDVYPPTFEIYQVPPGADLDTTLPPLEDGRTAAVTPP